MRLIWVFFAIPVIEIALFIQVGGLIGLWPTLALVVLTAVIGSYLMRRQGARALLDVQRSFNELRDPTAPMAHGAMILLAGALLLTPGFFTDTIGFLLLVPGIRNWALKKLASRVHVVRSGFTTSAGFDPRGHRRPFDDGVIDGDYTVEGDDPNQDRDGGHLDGPGTAANDPKRGSGWTRH